MLSLKRLYALTIAGGRGERLRPITDELPKSMAPVAGKPLLERQVEWLVAGGVTDVVFLCGYMGEKIREHFGDGSAFAVRAHYSFEETPLGRGGAVRQGMEFVPSSAEYVIALNGDNLTAQDLGELVEVHQSRGATATMMLTPFMSPYGVVEVDEAGMVSSFVEKGRLPLWINAGIYVFSRGIAGLLPEIGDHETTAFPQLASEGRLAALRSSAPWYTVDSPKELRELSALVENGDLQVGGL